jgi:hypothetical protein
VFPILPSFCQFIEIYRVKILITSPGFAVGNKGLHSLTWAKPSLYKVRIVLFTPVLEPKITTFRGSLLGFVSVATPEEADSVDVGNVFAKKL